MKGMRRRGRGWSTMSASFLCAVAGSCWQVGMVQDVWCRSKAGAWPGLEERLGHEAPLPTPALYQRRSTHSTHSKASIKHWDPTLACSYLSSANLRPFIYSQSTILSPYGILHLTSQDRQRPPASLPFSLLLPLLISTTCFHFGC